MKSFAARHARLSWYIRLQGWQDEKDILLCHFLMRMKADRLGKLDAQQSPDKFPISSYLCHIALALA